LKEEIRRLEREKAERRARKKEKERSDKKKKDERRARKKEKERSDKKKKDERRARKKEKERSDKKKKEKDKKIKEVNEYKKENPLEYYKLFSKKPIDFRELYRHSDSDNNYSSSIDNDSSSDDFPSPNTPIKNNKTMNKSFDDNNHKDLFKKVKELQRRLYELEIQNRKLLSQKQFRN